jgi:hypothetical protein
MGAKLSYTTEIADEICERIANGEPLRVICRDKKMPSWTTVYNWLNANEDFSKRFARARDLGEEALFQQCLDISDDERHDWLLTKKGTITNEVAIGRAKLQVWTRLQLLAKWNPKKYGDRTTIAGDQNNPLAISVIDRLTRAEGTEG